MSDHAHADLGSLGDEASKLLDAVQDWARRSFGESEGESVPIATGSPECQWCPICQLVTVVRGERPEITEKIVTAGEALLAVLRSAFAPAPGPAPSVQRIDLEG